MDRLLDHHTPGEPLYEAIAQRTTRCHGRKDRYTRLREQGMLTRDELA